jgi:hypothetical protein
MRRLWSLYCRFTSKTGLRGERGTLVTSGAMVQRLARGPFKAEIRVRFPLALPGFRSLSARSADVPLPEAKIPDTQGIDEILHLPGRTGAVKLVFTMGSLLRKHSQPTAVSGWPLLVMLGWKVCVAPSSMPVEAGLSEIVMSLTIVMLALADLLASA